MPNLGMEIDTIDGIESSPVHTNTNFIKSTKKPQSPKKQNMSQSSSWQEWEDLGLLDEQPVGVETYNPQFQSTPSDVQHGPIPSLQPPDIHQTRPEENLGKTWTSPKHKTPPKSILKIPGSGASNLASMSMSDLVANAKDGHVHGVHFQDVAGTNTGKTVEVKKETMLDPPSPGKANKAKIKSILAPVQNLNQNVPPAKSGLGPLSPMTSPKKNKPGSATTKLAPLSPIGSPTKSKPLDMPQTPGVSKLSPLKQLGSVQNKYNVGLALIQGELSKQSQGIPNPLEQTKPPTPSLQPLSLEGHSIGRCKSPEPNGQIPRKGNKNLLPSHTPQVHMF